MIGIMGSVTEETRFDLLACEVLVIGVRIDPWNSAFYLQIKINLIVGINLSLALNYLGIVHGDYQ